MKKKKKVLIACYAANNENTICSNCICNHNRQLRRTKDTIIETRHEKCFMIPTWDYPKKIDDSMTLSATLYEIRNKVELSEIFYYTYYKKGSVIRVSK